MELRDYQADLAQKGCRILTEKGIVYLVFEVRVGKTLTALEIARLYGAKKVLFLTKKKAISSIQGDYEALAPGYGLTVINDQSLHKVEGNFDLVIHDEHHRCLLGSTLIDEVALKDIEVGSFQKSVNIETGEIEMQPVLNVFKNPLTENLIKIKCNGKEIICTESHKIFTRRGWVEAKNILSSDELQVV